MPRRIIASACVSASLLGASTMSFAEEAAPPGLPRPTCTQHITDATGDADPQFLGSVSTAAVFGNNPALDITALHVRVTSDEVLWFLGIDQFDAASAMEPYASAYRYSVTAKLGTKTFTYKAQQLSAGHPLLPSDQGTYSEATISNAEGEAVSIPGYSATFIPGVAPVKNFVVFRSPRAGVETALGSPILPTDTFTSVYGKTATWIYNRSAEADINDTPEAQAIHTASDDFCFGPAPTALSGLTTTPVQYGDSTTLSVTLKGGEKDEPLSDKDVVFSTDTATLGSAKTDAAGLARATARTSLLAGNHSIAASYAGSPELRAGTVTGTLIVKPEVTVFSALVIGKPSTTTRTATTTVLDDDKSPVAGRKVEWYVNGKRVATTTTDASGKTTYKSLKAGQTVQAKFPTVSNMYAASASKAVKV